MRSRTKDPLSSWTLGSHGIWDMVQWYVEALFPQPRKSLNPWLLGFLMETSLFRHDWLNHWLLMTDSASNSYLSPRNQRVELKVPAFYSYLLYKSHLINSSLVVVEGNEGKRPSIKIKDAPIASITQESPSFGSCKKETAQRANIYEKCIWGHLNDPIFLINHCTLQSPHGSNTVLHNLSLLRV